VWYWLFKFVLLGPPSVAVYRPRWVGRDRLPPHGAFVLASNHTSMIETVFVPMGVPRKVAFVAKTKYYSGHGITGRGLAWFLDAIGQVPIDPTSAATASPALHAARSILDEGRVWAVFPEGTRSPDGRMYRGRTGAMRVALPAGVPVVPVAVTGARTAGPWWRWRRGGSRITVEYLAPLDLSPWRGREEDPTAWREATDALMARIREATGQEYADRYPTAEEMAERDEGGRSLG
jgi:1-acyl-sn-glycerol-3-phosphate acyltransferase